MSFQVGREYRIRVSLDRLFEATYLGEEFQVMSRSFDGGGGATGRTDQRVLVFRNLDPRYIFRVPANQVVFYQALRVDE